MYHYPIFFLIVVAYLFNFVLAQAAKTRRLFFLSGLLFVGGAIGLEMLEGYVFKLYGTAGHIYIDMLCCAEELLEMVGVTVFIYALLDYLSKSTSVVLLVLDEAKLK